MKTDSPVKSTKKAVINKKCAQISKSACICAQFLSRKKYLKMSPINIYPKICIIASPLNWT